MCNKQGKNQIVTYRKYNLVILSVSILLYVVNKTTKFHEPNESLLKYIWDYNFTDFLCQLVYFSLFNLILELIKKKGVYSFKTILILSAICCLYWEIGVMYIQSGTVFDAADFISYLLGALFYYLFFRLVRDT